MDRAELRMVLPDGGPDVLEPDRVDRSPALRSSRLIFAWFQSLLREIIGLGPSSLLRASHRRCLQGEVEARGKTRGNLGGTTGLSIIRSKGELPIGQGP